MSKAPSVLILMGETAAGKTALAIALAQMFNAEIISADSRQIYRGMDIGTAAPDAAERACIPHHLVGFLDPRERYSAARFTVDAARLIQEIHGRGKRVVIVGGTGFYIRSLCGEMRLGEGFDAQLRTRMQREQALHDPAWLYEWLCIRDPRRAAMLDARDAYRVVRALEQSLSAPIAADAATESLPTLPTLGFERQKFWLRQPADILESRIAQRTTRMLDAGLLAEAERIGVGAVAASAVGYEHVFGYLAGQSTGPELVAAISRGTRQYAKRQRTWLRREPDLMSVPATTSLDAWRELAEAHCGWAG